jgi:glycosyltransferase involved in cell wall biosynthesis
MTAHAARFPGERRSRHVCITSVFGHPLDGGTWSGAPCNLAAALREQGIEVGGIYTGPDRPRMAALAVGHALRTGRVPFAGEQVRRGAAARRHGARVVAEAAATHGITTFLHTGTLDLPPADSNAAVRHVLYCDHTWHLARQHLPSHRRYRNADGDRIEELERRSFAGAAHIFTFGAYVRDDLIDHYRIAPERVSAVGSGRGAIAPYFGPKDYANGVLLFVAKHLFEAKGGPLVLDAFRRVRARRPDARLLVVAQGGAGRSASQMPGVELFGFLSWDELQTLYRSASLLVQPMLNDPWGQVYLEALASGTPVLGLRRNGLPEITEGGRHGFLVDGPDPDAVAEAILAALDDPALLAAMGASGRRHVLDSYSWHAVASRMARVMFAEETFNVVGLADGVRRPRRAADR